MVLTAVTGACHFSVTVKCRVPTDPLIGPLTGHPDFPKLQPVSPHLPNMDDISSFKLG